MSDSTRIIASTAVGAVIGGLAAFLLLTPRGRQLLAQVNPTLDELSDLLQETRRAVGKVDALAREARCAAADVRAALAGADTQTGA